MKVLGKYVVIAVVLAAIGLVVFLLVKQRANRTVGEKTVQDAIPVETVLVAEREFRDEIHAVATLKAQEVSPLSSKVPGNVAAVLVDIGTRVKSGDILLELDDTNFDLGAKQAEANFQQADRQYERARALLAEKVIPQSRYDAAEAAYAIAREALAMAREHLKNTKIRAPIDGVVVERNVEVGQAVAPGAQVLRIVNQSSMKIDVDLPEKDFGRVSPNMSAIISVDAFQEKVFHGQIALINPMISPKTRTFRVRIEIPNPSGTLADGMFARVCLVAGKKNAMAVSRDALQRLPGSGTYYVFVVDGEKAVKRTIKTGIIGDSYAEIVDGLSEGENVVASGAGRLRSGTEVVVSKSAEGAEHVGEGGTAK